MEYSLHRELKQLYAGEAAQTEVRLGRWRIDAVVEGELIEIQLGSLAAIRQKVTALVAEHRVRVVKPIIREKRLLKLRAAGAAVVERRLSPKHGTWLDLFEELIFFRHVFPHPNLSLDVALVDIEELRYPGHGRRRRWRRNDYQAQDQRLVEVHETRRFATLGDILALLPDTLPTEFDTAELAAATELPRHRAQKMAYCLRHMQGLTSLGKRGRAQLYQIAAQPRTRSRRRDQAA